MGGAILEDRAPDFDVPGAMPEWIALQRALLVSQRSAFAAKWAEANSARYQRRMLEEAGLATRRKLEAALHTAREREEKVRPHVGLAMPYFEYLKLKEHVLNLEHELAAQYSVARAAKQERLAAEQRLRLLAADHRTNLMNQIKESKELVSALRTDRLRTAQRLAQRKLLAPVDGHVQALSIHTEGGVVTSGQTLATIVPDGTPLIIDALLSNEHVGYVRLGQQVSVKIDTFPFQQYGTLAGVVTWISPDAEPISQADGFSPTPNKAVDAVRLPGRRELMYRVHIRPERAELVADGKQYPVAIGMTVQAEMVANRQRLISVFLAPFARGLGFAR